MRKKTIAAFVAVLLAILIVLPGCREREIFGTAEVAEWTLLNNDPDEGGVAYNGQYLFYNTLHVGQGNLTFKVQTYASIPNPGTDAFMSIYLDTDQSNGTGYTGFDASTTPNDIGAEYMMLVGTETGTSNSNMLYSWNSGGGNWDEVGGITVNAYADSLIGTVGLSSIGNPTAVDIVAILLVNPGNSELRDKIPDNGHATVNVTTLQVVQTYDPRVTQEIHYPGKRISVVSGKEIDLEEVQ